MSSFGVKLMIVLAIIPILEIKSLLELEAKIDINKRKCDVEKGEVYMECRTECPLTCDNYTENQKCPKTCVAGCFCQQGTVRRESDNSCVEIENLKTKSPSSPESNLKENKRDCEYEKGEKFLTCGSACPDTCDNYNEVRPCTLQCVIGCGCPSSDVRRESDQYCVKPEDFVQSISQLDNECDTPCIGGPNDICKICAWACPDTCDNVDNPPPCHAPCKPNTCDCVEGTVRNLATGQCVLPMSCPSKSITHFNK
ncbi:hypothetical protein PV326_004147 [Microctonus aethiopoides]|nr:hypothetical protein PV326_004147 [Microctonus aethiopoides]